MTEKKLTIKRLLLTRSQKPLIKLEIYLKITICVNVELMVPTWRLTISLAITKRRITNKKNLWLLAYLLQHIYSYLKPNFHYFYEIGIWWCQWWRHIRTTNNRFRGCRRCRPPIMLMSMPFQSIPQPYTS